MGLLVGTSPAVRAVDLTWSADGVATGGSGAWDQSALRWLDTTTQAVVAWNNADPGVATFAGTSGTVTLADALAATQLSFTVDGYLLAASANPAHTLSLSLGIDASGDTTISAPLVLSAANTWSVTTGKNLTVSGPVSGTSDLTKTGDGTLTLSGANTFTGWTTLSAGTLVLGHTSALAGSTLNLGGTGTLSFASPGTYLLAGLTGSQALNLGSSTLSIGGSGLGSVYSGVLSGSGGLTKTGDGILELLGINTFTGKVAVTGGSLWIAAESGLGATPATATADAVTLDGGALLLTTGNVTFSANRGFTLGAGGGTLDTSSITDATNNSVTFAGGISGTGGLTLRAHGDLSASGGGSNTRVLLSGANTFTGAVTITDGLVDAASSFGAATNALRFTNGGGLVQTAGTSTIARPIEVLAGGGT